MADAKLFIPLVLGTRRQGRESEKVARYVLARLEAHPEVETKLIDTRDLTFPADQDGRDVAKSNPGYKEDIARCDGLVVVAPEYNRGIPGPLKMTLDMLYPEYKHKVGGVVTVSAGAFAGAKVAETIQPILTALGLVQLQHSLGFGDVTNAFDESGQPKDAKVGERADKFVAEVVWLAKSLRWGRQNLDEKK